LDRRPGNPSPTRATASGLINNTNPPRVELFLLQQGRSVRDILLYGNVGYFAVDDPARRRDRRDEPDQPPRRSRLQHGVAQSNQLRNHDLFIDGHFLYIASNQNVTMKVYDTPTRWRRRSCARRNRCVSGDTLHDMTVRTADVHVQSANGITQVLDVQHECQH